MPPEDDGELVESGGFRFDRETLLKRLSSHRFRTPLSAVDALARCAVAAGATKVNISETSDAPGFEARFDGRPFSRAEFKDPYSCLLQERTAENRPHWELAGALLNILFLEPASVTVTSGKGDARFEFRADSPTEDAVAPAPSDETRTVVRVRFKRLPQALAGNAVELRVRNSCGRAPIKIKTGRHDHWYYGHDKDKGPGLFFEAEGRYGCLDFGGHAGSSPDLGLRTLCLGVGLGEGLSLPFPLAPVSGYVNDDSFTPSLSLDGIVRDQRYEETAALVIAQAHRLFLREIELQRERMPMLAEWLQDPEKLRWWRARLYDWIPPEKVRGGQSPVPQWDAIHYDGVQCFFDVLPGFLQRFRPARPEYPDWADTLHRDASRTMWLREALVRALAFKDEKVPSGTVEELRETPLLLSKDNEPLTLDGIRKAGRAGVRITSERDLKLIEDLASG